MNSSRTASERPTTPSPSKKSGPPPRKSRIQWPASSSKKNGQTDSDGPLLPRHPCPHQELPRRVGPPGCPTHDDGAGGRASHLSPGIGRDPLRVRREGADRGLPGAGVSTAPRLVPGRREAKAPASAADAQRPLPARRGPHLDACDDPPTSDP